jgi:spore coat protein E
LSHTNRAVEYRQIITRAVCGKGRKFSQSTHHIQSPENIHTILGAWVINHQYQSSKVGESVDLTGSYDINIWYSTKGNTKTDVVKETVHYSEQVPLSYYDRNTYETSAEVSAAVTQVPNCVEAAISNSKDAISVRVEKEFSVEMIGKTKICVAVYPIELASLDDKELISDYSDIDNQQHFDDLDPDLVIDDLDD